MLRVSPRWPHMRLRYPLFLDLTPTTSQGLLAQRAVLLGAAGVAPRTKALRS